MTYLWLLLLLGQKLSERKTSNGFWCLDVTSDTSLEGSFLTKRHRLGWFLYKVTSESVFQIRARDENLAQDIQIEKSIT